MLCNALGVDGAVPASVQSELAECCNAAVPKTIQERAWSSPIWYRPEGIQRFRGSVRFGSQPGSDVLDVSMVLGSMPVGWNPATQPLTITHRDDDEMLSATIPAGVLQAQGGTGWLVLNDPAGTHGGIRQLAFLKRGGGRVVVRIKTVPGTLAAADRTDHFVELSLRGGTADVTTTPFWQMAGRRLVANP